MNTRLNRFLGRVTAAATAAALLGALPASAQVVEYYHLDAIGSVRAVSNQSGDPIERHDLLPYGEDCTTSPCNTALPGTNTKRFTGKERDSESGLDYFGARYYGSRIGRFTSVDPVVDQAALVDPQRWNRYAYGLNNPFKYLDPDGRNPWLMQLLQRIANSPAGQRVGQFVSTQAANLRVAAMRLSNSPAAREGVQVGAELASGADLPGGVPGNLPFKSGDIIRRQFDTSKGVVEIMAEAVIEGKRLHLKDVAVYPWGVGKLDVGMKEILEARRALADQAKELGFEELAITGTRRTGANPGKVVDVTIPLVKKEE